MGGGAVLVCACVCVWSVGGWWAAAGGWVEGGSIKTPAVHKP